MASDSTEKWIRFFTKAGIPSRAATTYALTFADNRIQMDMLLDLNKEYLRDMGITLMGDVIAILRHARQVHEELTHEKLLYSKPPLHNASENPQTPIRVSASSAALPPVPKATKTLKSVAASVPKSASSSSLNSSSRSPSGSPQSANSPAARKTTDNSIHVKPISRSSSNTVPSSIAVSTGGVEKIVTKRLGAAPEAMKRKSTVTIIENQVKDVIIDEDLSTPLKKVRRVLPEHEGGYKIKMPSGTTPRSQQILAKQKESVVSKKTVFDRLGRTSPTPDSLSAAVSSTTSDPVFAVTGLGSESTLKKKSSSVFSRLGDKQVSSTSTVISLEEKSLSAPSMVADSVSNPLRSEVRGRLGSSVQGPRALKSTATVGAKPKILNTGTEGILAGSSAQFNRGVKARLGETGNPSGLKETVNLKRRLASLPQDAEPASRRIKINPKNGNFSQPVKKVSFSDSARSVPTKAGVFSRLGR